MAIKSRSQVIAAKLETTFNVAESLTSADTIEVNDSSNVDVSIETKERKVIRDSLLDMAPIPIRESSKAAINVEVAPSGTADDLIGDPFFEAGMGVKSPAGSGTGAFIGYSDAGVTPADMIYMAQSGDTGTAVAYTLAGTTAQTKSLTVKEFIGADKSVLTTGNVVSSIKIALPTADVATVAFDMEGCSFTVNESDTKLAPACTNALPYLGKSAKYVFDGVSMNATDVNIDIANTVYNVEAITSAGYSAKAITGAKIDVSFKLLFEDYSLLSKFQNSADGSLYVELDSGANKFAVYIPTLRITNFSKSDNGGVLEQQITAQVIVDCGSSSEPIIIASEVA